MKLSDRNWKEFNISDLFSIELSTGDNQAKLLQSGKIPLVTAGNLNNGICKYIAQGDKKSPLFSKNILTIDMFGKMFYQPASFFAVSHGRVNILIPKFIINKYIAFFIISVFEKKSLNRYSFSNMCNKRRLYNETIYLPFSSNLQPDYEFMEAYMREKEEKFRNQYKKFISSRLQQEFVPPKKPTEWKEFEIEQIFKSKIGKNIDGNKINKNSGKIPYITRKECNNGLEGFINSNKTLINNEYPVITIGNETAQPFVQNYSFFTGTKVNILKPTQYLSKYVLMYIKQSLECHKKKFSYSYTINSTRLKKQKIMLPITESGQPDYAYMENYMKYLEQKKLKQYLNYINKK